MTESNKPGRAILAIRPTAYYITLPDGEFWTDAEGHMWFSKTVARETAPRVGGHYQQSTTRSLKQVVTGYRAPEEGES